MALTKILILCIFLLHIEGNLKFHFVSRAINHNSSHLARNSADSTQDSHKFLPLSFFFLLCFSFAKLSALWTKGKHTQGLICSSSSSVKSVKLDSFQINHASFLLLIKVRSSFATTSHWRNDVYQTKYFLNWKSMSAYRSLLMISLIFLRMKMMSSDTVIMATTSLT